MSNFTKTVIVAGCLIAAGLVGAAFLHAPDPVREVIMTVGDIHVRHPDGREEYLMCPLVWNGDTLVTRCGEP